MRGLAGRHWWMDLLRGTAVLLVVFFHAAALPTDLFGIEVPSLATKLNRVLEPYRQPTLLAISGLLLSRSLAKPLGNFYAGKLRRIYWPFFVWTIVTAALVSPSILWRDPEIWYRGFIHTWYLSTLLACYLLAPALRRIPWWLVTVGLISVWLVAGPVFSGGERFWFYGSFFFFGAALAPCLSRLQAAQIWLVTGLGCLTFVGVVGAVTGSAGYALRWHWVIISLSGVMLIMWIGLRIPQTTVTHMLAAAGRNSMPLYVIHVPAMLAVGHAWRAAALPGGWVAYLAFVTVGLIVPLAFMKVPGTNWLLEFPLLRTGQETIRTNS